MLKAISSKNDSEVYRLGRSEKEKAKVVSSFVEIDLAEAEVFAENVSIFGDKSAYIVNLNGGVRGVTEENLDKLSLKLLQTLHNSEHFFLLVGSGAEFEDRVEQEGKDLKIKALKVEEKKVFDFPTDLVKALQKKDKKNSWYLLLKELEKKDAEPVHGSCIFAYKSMLVYLNDPKKNSPKSGVKDFTWKQASVNAKLGKRGKAEVVDKYFDLVVAYHKARMGELDLSKQLERWVLEN
jgi:hypothetical protein